MNIGIAPRILLIGPYDPHCGEYTFLAPPLGVWRLAGVLRSAGIHAKVFDPNCCRETPQRALERELSSGAWDVVGCSTTGMTLRFDLELAYLARRTTPRALILAGGMEATFRPQLMFELGPFDLVILGEGERPLLELAARLRSGQPLAGMRGTAQRTASGELVSIPQAALNREELRDAIYSTPYEQMPYADYWERLEAAYRVGALPSKAAREAHLAEIRSVRLSTLNYCPMNCSFCSATNFLQEAQGSVAAVARLEAGECMAMIERIIAAHPRTRTVIFQDDIFTFTRDRRVLALCDAIVEAKRRGRLPAELQFISTNRIDAMSEERLAALKRAGFRVLGFGIESFSQRVLQEFNKAHIHRFIEPMLSAALSRGNHTVPRHHLELAARHARRRRRNAAGRVPVAAPRLRDRHVSVRNPVLRSRLRARPRALAAHPIRAPSSDGHGHRMGPSREDPTDRSGGARGHFAYGAWLRDGARIPREARGAPALARPLAALDLERHSGSGGVRPVYR